MKQIKLLGAIFVSVVAFSSVVAAATSAATLPNILPEGTLEKPVTATTKNGESTFGNGILKLKSPNATGSQTGNGPTLGKLGLFITVFNEVESKTAGTKCTGLSNATEGQITVLGTFHIRDYTNSAGELKTASILLLLPVHFSCASILVTVLGCVAGALTPENTLTKTLTLTIAETSSEKDNQIVTVLNEADTANELCQLLAKEGSGATKLSVQKQTVEIEKFRQNGSEVTVLVMPL